MLIILGTGGQWDFPHCRCNECYEVPFRRQSGTLEIHFLFRILSQIPEPVVVDLISKTLYISETIVNMDKVT